uniref:BZIP domain-containing protein n=1 Tax=Arion vulgaris TaxID=1028688 RepID=A0A0B6ZPG0_9EUPU
MATTVTTHSSCVRASRISTLSSLATSVDSCSMSPKTCMSLPSSPISMSGMSLPSSPISMSGLLNSRNLVQDEKLVVATLATLNSGSASNLIKQDLKWIIQSRRKAEGKTELQVEFKKPVKDQLTSEELVKRARRRELNRLAARRSREKGQKRKDMLVEEIRKLQSQNCELVNVLGDLTEQRNSIVGTLRQHMKQCSDYLPHKMLLLECLNVSWTCWVFLLSLLMKLKFKASLIFISALVTVHRLILDRKVHHSLLNRNNIPSLVVLFHLLCLESW